MGEYLCGLFAKIKIEIVVLDDDLGKVFNAIVTSARTGEGGDGKNIYFACGRSCSYKNRR